MRLRPDFRQAPGAADGFTLLEAVIAAALVLLTITAVTPCVVSVSHAGARLEGHTDADRAAWRVAERLGVLPFCADSYPQAARSGGRASDLVEAVFPHADVARSTGSACYFATAGAGGEAAGSFITMLNEDGVDVTCVARFLASPAGPELGPTDLSGWRATSGSAPPSGTLSVTLSVPGGGQRARFVRSALSRPPIFVTTTAAP